MITAMLNWYDEEPSELRRIIRDVRTLGANTVVAVGGPYSNFPGGADMPVSPQAAHDALREECIALGMAYVSCLAPVPWPGDEVAKRQVMLKLALAVTPPTHWLMVYDADWELLRCDVDVPELLEGCAELGLNITFTTSPDDPAGDHPLRMFMRVMPGMRMGSNHYTYEYADGRKQTIMGDASAVPAMWHKSIRVYHKHYERDEERHARQSAYYHIRDTRKLEAP